MQKLTQDQYSQLILKNDMLAGVKSIENACEVIVSFIDLLELGMNKHKHFDGYIEKYINQTRWVIARIFDNTLEFKRAFPEKRGVAMINDHVALLANFENLRRWLGQRIKL